MKGLLMPNETMPDCCAECPCFRTDEYNGHEASECMCKLITFGDNDGWIYHTRPNWCPLVEIVRCKDCRYYHADEAVNSKCGDCGIWAKKLVDHGYCFMGKKRGTDDGQGVENE